MNSEQLKEQGQDFVKIFKQMNIDCSLKNCLSNELVDKFEFDLKQLDINCFKQIKKAIEIMRLCLHKDIQQTDNTEHHFAIEIKKEQSTLDLLTLNNKYKNEDKFSALIGMENDGNPVYFNPQKSIHTLIGGATGMGKTSIINNIIYSLTAQNTPKELNLYLIDIKKTLTIWNGLPHLTRKPIDDPCDALDALEDISTIMDERHEMLAQKRLTKATPGMFPHIVIVIDELADLMLSGLQKWIEREIVHIAQVGRDVNISLIIATQNPLVKVCTSLIKANCPTRIALKTVSAPDSRNVLGNQHAFLLDGVGSAIIRSADNPTERVFKACYLQEENIKNYIKEIKGNK